MQEIEILEMLHSREIERQIYQEKLKKEEKRRIRNYIEVYWTL